MKRIITLLFLLFISFTSYSQNYQQDKQPLPADSAFKFYGTAKDSQTIVAKWEIAPGYYLYRHRFQFSVVKAKDIKLGEPLLPAGTFKVSPEIGKYEIYRNKVLISIPVIKTDSNNFILQATYQGCSDKGYCYPPTTKVVPINLAENYMHFISPLNIDVATKLAEKTPLSETTKAATLLIEKNLLALIFGFFGFGILLSLTPCVLPMIPILSGIILGHGEISHLRAFFLSLAYVLGMAITYAIAGIIFGFIGGTLQAIFQQPWIIILFSLIFIAMALSLFGFYNIQLPEKWRSSLAHASQHQKAGNYIGVAMMGCLSTLILSPCVTPPLVAVLGYISQTGNATLGGIALFAMGIGMGIPLLIIGTFGPKLLPKTGKWMNVIKYIIGILLLAIAIYMLQRILPGLITMLLWAALVIGISVYMGAFSTIKGKLAYLQKAIAILFFIYGILLILGAMTGNYNPLTPLNVIQQPSLTKTELSFIKVKTIEDVSKEISAAKAQGKPIMLDFYADWCIACKEMDHFTFTDPDVKKRLANFVRLRADVTANDMEDKALEKYYDVVAPPTILFFDANGNEITQARIIGEMSASKFLKHLDKINSVDI